MPALSYYNNIPTATQLLRDSQPLMLANFASIMTLIDQNHVDFADPNNAGMHNLLQMVPQSNALANQPTAPTGGMVLYNAIPNVAADANFPVTLTNSELNLVRQGSAAVLPITASILNGSSPTVFQPGWTYLPSGILLKWSANVTATGQQTITFPTGADIPVFGTCLTVLVSIAEGTPGTDLNHAIRVTGVNPTNFAVYASGRTVTGPATVVFTYLAIGY